MEQRKVLAKYKHTFNDPFYKFFRVKKLYSFFTLGFQFYIDLSCVNFLEMLLEEYFHQ